MQLFFFSNAVVFCKCSADKHSKPQQGSHGKYIRRQWDRTNASVWGLLFRIDQILGRLLCRIEQILGFWNICLVCA